MSRTAQAWGIGGLLIVVVALIVAAASPGRTVIGTDDDALPTNWNEQLTSETALVAAKHATGGLKLAGIRLDEKTYRLDLHFLGSPECTVGACAGPDELIGEVAGITTEGNRIVSSSIEVSRECYHLIKTTDPWPSFPECMAIVGD
ncbi:MAG: hypothetical protein OEM32_10670 [Acidimicrobiia bacterium]|nr:hypothetical protein [Acidimicrobiia bacterium]